MSAVLGHSGPIAPLNVPVTSIANPWGFEIEPTNAKTSDLLIGHHWSSLNSVLVFYLAWSVFIRIWMHCRIICSHINVNGFFTRVWFPWEPSSIVSCWANYLYSQSKLDRSFHMLYVKWKILLLLIFLSSWLSCFLKICFRNRTQYIYIYYNCVCICVWMCMLCACNYHSALYVSGNKSRCTF